jgi:hypothetical protein
LNKLAFITLRRLTGLAMASSSRRQSRQFSNFTDSKVEE